MKTVFNKSEIAHVWARQSQQEGRTSTRNIYFDGPMIYSYGSHFCMAKILPNNVVLICDRSYSVTTSGHLLSVRYAVNHLERVFVPHPESVTNSIKVWIDRIKSELAVLGNTRKRPQTKERSKNELNRIIHNSNRMFELLGYKIKSKWSYNDEIRREFITLIESIKVNPELAGQELALFQEKERKKATAKQLKNLAEWIGVKSTKGLDLDKVYLRVKESPYDTNRIVETTRGARVSLESAKLLYTMIVNGKDVKGHEIDGYTVISLNGVLTIGCHKIERSEIARFAKLMNW